MKANFTDDHDIFGREAREGPVVGSAKTWGMNNKIYLLQPYFWLGIEIYFYSPDKFMSKEKRLIITQNLYS